MDELLPLDNVIYHNSLIAEGYNYLPVCVAILNINLRWWLHIVVVEMSPIPIGKSKN